ncbi:MAG: hypothetical protein CMN73_04605 [Sphingomonas sp.]|nr:hypothetical protein [Sphingomonas sp.]
MAPGNASERNFCSFAIPSIAVQTGRRSDVSRESRHATMMDCPGTMAEQVYVAQAGCFRSRRKPCVLRLNRAPWGAGDKNMRSICIAGLLVALTACGEGEPPENLTNEAAQNVVVPETGPVIGGVDLSQPVRAWGTEPYWTLDLLPGTIYFSDRSALSEEPDQFYYVAPDATAATAVYRTQDIAGASVVITLTAARCQTGGNADLVPLAVEIRRGDQVLRGCADQAPGEIDLGDNVSEENASTADLPVE